MLSRRVVPGPLAALPAMPAWASPNRPIRVVVNVAPGKGLVAETGIEQE